MFRLGSSDAQSTPEERPGWTRFAHDSWLDATEVAFVADSLGMVVRTFPVASGKSQWDHLEWSNHPQWAVGVAREGSSYKKLDLLDLSAGGTVPVVQGSELWMARLWAGNAEEFSLKTQRFWSLRNRLNIAFVGSSRGKSGINPSLFTSGKVLNW